MSKIMKLLLLLVSLSSITFSSCTEEISLSENNQDQNLDSKLQWVIDLANQEAERLLPPESRTASRKATLNNLKTINGVTSRSETDTLIYVVNYEDNNGFALISAVDLSDPVLAVVPHGNYDPDSVTNNPGFNMFLDAAKNSAQRIGKLDPIEGDPSSTPYYENGKFVKIERTTECDEKCDPKLGYDFQWNQDGFYGNYCSNGLTGCVPLAIASIVTYYRALYNNSTTIQYTFKDRPISEETVNWASLFRHKRSVEIYSDTTWHDHIGNNCEYFHLTLARVLRQIGQDCDANYKDPQKTSVRDSKVQPVLRKYMTGYSVSGLTSFNSHDVRNVVKSGVMLMTGRSDDGGHAWVCDGYTYKSVIEKRYEADPPLIGNLYNWQLVSTVTKSTAFNYMHWGWGGEHDGWFKGSVFDPLENGEPFNKDIKYINVEKYSFVIQ